MTNIGKIMKNKGISMATKFKIVEAMDFQWQCIAVKSSYLERARERKQPPLDCGSGKSD